MLLVAASFPEFLAEHRAEHRSAFNRWCLTVGDSLQVIGALYAMRGRWRRAGLMVVGGLGVVAVGHVRDGNFPKSVETTRLHPIWNIRGDIAIARDVLTHRS
jgi:hypothetical protein